MIKLNKKGQSADGITWIFAFIIIIFILALFLLGVNLIINGWQKNELNIKEIQLNNLKSLNEFYEGDNIDFSENKPNIIEVFFNENYDLIDKWAYGEDYYDEGELLRINNGINSEDKNTSELYNELLNHYIEFVNKNNISNPFFYLRAGDRKFSIIKETIDNKFFLIYDPPKVFFNQNNFGEDLNVKKNKLFFISKNGEVVMIVFYDKDKAIEEYDK